jgi:hypothetical protein
MKYRTLVILVGLAASFGGCHEPDIGTLSQEVVGICQRIPAQLSGPERVCRDDLDCPCGSFCDESVRVCTYSCMPPGEAPPGSGTPAPGMFNGNPSPCAGDLQCDDSGRCVSPTEGLTVAALLSANPPTLTTVAGGPAKPFDVRLRLTDSTPTTVEAAESTVVHVVGREGAKVSCDGATFVERCTLTDWSFVLVGQGLQATQVARVQTVSGTADGRGDVLLAIEATGARVIVPAVAITPRVNEDGRYAGIAISPAYPGGIRVTAVARNRKLLVREPSRTIAPDGALLLDIDAATAPTTRRKAVWLREAGAPDTAGAIVGDYIAGKAIVDLQAGTMSVPLSFNVPGAAGLEGWTVMLTRFADGVAECDAQTPCASGSVCRAELQACVPEPVWTPTTAPVGNALIDQRSELWWSKVSPLLSNASEGSAFNITGPDLVESVMCSTLEGTRGKLAISQVMRGGNPLSRSGDLDCITRDGVKTQSPGAVGFATLADRVTSDAELLLQVVHARCMTDLARQAPTTGLFSSHFGATVGTCVNLSRFVPALRLLATDPLNRGTIAELEPRARGLVVRLTQQWAMLQGFLATTGASQQDYASFLDPTPASTTRTALTRALDAVDQGWNALLDQRIAPTIRNAVRWSPGSDNDAIRDASRDYRLVKRPIVYWTFNNPTPPANPLPNTPPGPAVDIVNGVALIPQGSVTSACQIRSGLVSGGAFAQGFNCPGHVATLPNELPSLVDDANLGGIGKVDNLTVTINVDDHDNGGPGTTALLARSDSAPETDSCPGGGCDPPPGEEEEEDPPRPPPTRPAPYRGGTLLATPTLAIAESVDPVTRASALVLAHASATGVELTTFTGYGRLGSLPDPADPFLHSSTTIAVVRDAKRKQYTLYVWQPTGLWQQTKSYVKDPDRALDWVPAKTIRIGDAGALAAGHYWTPYKKAFGGFLDDIAVFDSALSAAEILQLASTRQDVETRRTVWPVDMNLQRPAPAEVTQDVASPLGAQLLEAQVAELELASRLLTAMQDRAQLACDGDPASTTAAAARAEIDAAIARVGRILRRSHLLEGIAVTDISERAVEARRLLAAKRIELARASEPVRCTEPFQMADDEVPLYHDTIPDGMPETDAFFAASGFLQGLALQHATSAMSRRTAAETAYVNARASQIQQIEADNIRDDRLLAIKNQYGDGLRRLCGLSHQTNVDFVHDNFEEPDPAHPFSVDTCYVAPTTACLAQHGGPLIDADASCYRGQLGENLMGLRSAYYAYQAADQSWRTAAENAKAAGKFCVWKEMDAFGCSALNRHELSGVTCPPGHQGTVELTQTFNDDMFEQQKLKAIVTGIGNLLGSVASGIASGPAGMIGGGLKGISDGIGQGFDVEIQRRQRAHQLVLTKRANQADIVACWNEADQYERAIQTAELSAKQALAQFEAAGVGFANAIGEAEQLTIELRAALAREASRPSIPIAFHYWLGGAISAYETELETARRYTYLALRATEYDMQDSYKLPATGKPLRSTVLAATHPQQLLDQLTLMQAQTNQRMLNGRRPSTNHLTFDVGEWLWGLPIGSSLASRFDARLRPVLDKTGAYLGVGLRFSFIPQRDDDAPVWRCAERIWRVAVGATNFPADQPNHMITKLIKRNTFASRRCGADGLQVARWRSKVNLFVATGQASGPNLDDPLPAHTPLVRLDTILQEFRERDDAFNSSSRELSLLGLYGDYVLLFPKAALERNLIPRNLGDLNIRFDYLSVDDTPAIPLLTTPAASGTTPRPEIRIDDDPSPIVLD